MDAGSQEEEFSFPARAAHPTHCSRCGGSGWMEVAPIKSQAAGDDVVYSQVAPCTHHWSNDDPEPELFDWPGR